MPFQLLPLLFNVLIGFAIQLIGYMFMPRPKGPKPDELKDAESPTAEAGMPIPVPFGDITITGVNYLWTGEKETTVEKVK
ncbi:hypothetical protein IQ03_02458 [Gemmobacter caeni]|uniref:Uncharacterized protein n=1 Tax=Gemmobacter caeni TaxID=589035 RepID=A0A2T6AZ27_9RHOB|nr:hypothetical protein [Gemmobacter caeni]PTX49067.1 hypothetical protein C8N34_108177 [Gemmobacter caeni]TWI98932.1 hypothetical protein IQ03_02458 [Gemmobacter caeni]